MLFLILALCGQPLELPPINARPIIEIQNIAVYNNDFILPSADKIGFSEYNLTEYSA